jgi:hypothetical protein
MRQMMRQTRLWQSVDSSSISGLHVPANVASKLIGNRDVHLVHGWPLRSQSFSFQRYPQNLMMSIFDMRKLYSHNVRPEKPRRVNPCESAAGAHTIECRFRSEFQEIPHSGRIGLPLHGRSHKWKELACRYPSVRIVAARGVLRSKEPQVHRIKF